MGGELLTQAVDEGIDVIAASRQERLNEILRAKKDWLQKHRIYFYKPHGNQAQFHASKARIRMPYGTNRSGKTTASVVEDIALCLGFRPWLLPDDLKELPIETLLEMYKQGKIPLECCTGRRTPFKLILIEDDWDVADEILLTGTQDKPAKLRQYLPAGALVGGSLDKQEKNGMGYICKINFTNGSSITIDTEKSFTNDPGSFEGKSYDGAHYDEPKRRELRVAIKRGLVDTNGLEIFSLTPLAEPWMFDELYQKAKPGSEIETFFFDARDNPYISKEGWQAFLESLTEDEKEARALGKWVHLKGLVYKEFKACHIKQGGHIIDPIEPEWMLENATFIVSIDPHPRIPLAALFVAGDKHGRIIVWEELFMQTLVPDFCDSIRSKLMVKQESGYGAQNVNLYVCDPIAWTEDPIDGKNWAMSFMDCGIPVEKAPKRKDAGILEVRRAFKEGRLFVCSNCTRFLFEIQHYVWAEWRNAQGHSEKEKTTDKDDHLCECLYRAVLLEPQYIDPTSSKPIGDFRICR